MDIPRYVNESDQSWAKWQDVEIEEGAADINPGSGPMRDVVITPVPYAGDELPFVVQVPIATRDIPA